MHSIRHKTLPNCVLNVLSEAVNMEQFLDKEYQLVSSENFDDYLIFTNTPFLIRKAASALRPSFKLTKNDEGTYTYAFISNIAHSNITFKPGEEFVETKPAGEKTWTTITFEKNKMVKVCKRDDGNPLKHVLEFSPETMMETITTEGFDKIVTLKYVLLE